MKDYFVKTIQLLTYNFRPLIVFEVLYRVFGIAIVYPLATAFLYLSVELSGNEYIVNRDFIAYATKPTTLLLAFVFFLFFAVYVLYEIVVLAIVFHSSHHKQKVGIQSLLIVSFQRLLKVIKKYHILILSSSMVFLFLVELVHIVGIASTIQIPMLILTQIQAIKGFYYISIAVVVILFILFIETIFFELQCTIEYPSIKAVFSHSHHLLKGKRIIMLVQFAIINGIINAIFYLLYLLIITLVSVVLYYVRGESFVYPYILSILYTSYLGIGVMATIFLIPINYAYINAVYYKNKKTQDIEVLEKIRRVIKNRPFRNTVFYRILVGVLVVFSVVAVFSISAISNNPAKLEIFNNPSVIAHRGGGDYGPENTVAGIQQGLLYGADAIEIDVRFTSDGVPVLMHDATLTRTTNDISNTAVANITYEELLTFDAGSYFSEEYTYEPVPTLEEALDAINHRALIFLEIKAMIPGGEEIILELLQSYRVDDEVYILSFDYDLLTDMKTLDSDIETVLLLSSFLGDMNVLAADKNIDHIALRYDLALDNAEQLIELQKAGKGIYIWTVNNKDVIADINTLGVDGIITDYPLLTRQVVYADSKKSTLTTLLETLFTRDTP